MALYLLLGIALIGGIEVYRWTDHYRRWYERHFNVLNWEDPGEPPPPEPLPDSPASRDGDGRFSR